MATAIEHSGTGMHPQDRPLRVLVVEDEVSYRDALASALGREGYEVWLAADGFEGMGFFADQPPDIVLLDVLLPGISGIEVCRQMQASDPAIPIIMVSALNTEADVVNGLEYGAVDYLTKPYSLRELTARMQSVLRRVAAPSVAPNPAGETRLMLDPNIASASVGPITISFERHEVRLHDRAVHLSRREFEVLALLASPPGRIRTREELIDLIWSNKELSDTRTLDTHIRRLRKKLEPSPGNPRHLITVRGVGFRLDPE